MLILLALTSFSTLIPMRIANNVTSAKADSSDSLNVLSLMFLHRKKLDVGASDL